MIHVSRDRVSVPAVFSSREMQAERAKAEEFFSVGRKARAQRWFDWVPMAILTQDAAGVLSDLFKGKCAYCESLTEIPTLEYFRPHDGAINHDGVFAPDHYWWLAFEWTNLLPCCDDCDISKGKRFPVKRRRAAPGAKGRSLAREEPLLLDPCTDSPEEHLVFSEDGTVVSRTERGRITIEVLALNRRALVEQRQERIQDLQSLLDAMEAGERSPGAMRLLRRALLPTRPYLCAVQQYLRLWLKESHRPAGSLVRRDIERALARLGSPTVHTQYFSRKQIEETQRQFKRTLERKESHSVESETHAAKAAYFGGARTIERIEIRNFRAIRHLEIQRPARAGREAWLMLIGENGAGKSSVLQAVALALLGQRHVNKLGLDARQFLNHERDNKDDEGSVRVHLTNVSVPVELRFSRFSKHFTANPPSELVLLFGYGATRLLPRSVTTKDKPTRYVRVKNLFNPYARLQNAERWLTDRKRVSDAQFAVIARALKRLLLLDRTDEIQRDRRRIVVKRGRERNTLGDLSDGYQSVVALAADIMIGLADKWGDIDFGEAEGVVLIDEIEAHLHPRWKMEIVARLRAVFPKLAFIATTHDPLCLRGLKPGEIAVLRRESSGITAQIVEEPIDHLRADQLLTSPLFGLVGTRDPTLVPSTREDDRRYDELFLKKRRTAAEEGEFQRLKAGIIKRTAAGETPTDRFVELAVRQALTELSKAPPSSSVLEPKPADQEVEAALKAKFAELLS